MWSNGCKSNCARFIGIISIISFIIGLVLVIYGVLSFSGGSVDAGEYSHKFDMDVNAAMGYMAIVAGILAVVVSLLGCAAVKCMNCLTSCTFCIFAFIIGMLALIVGGIVMGLDWETVQYEACNK